MGGYICLEVSRLAAAGKDCAQKGEPSAVVLRQKFILLLIRYKSHIPWNNN